MVMLKARISCVIGIAIGSLLVNACVSQREIEIEADQQFDSMRSQTLIETDWKKRSYITCVAQAIIAELDEPFASMEWEIEIFDNEAVNAFAMPGGKIGVFTGILQVAENQDQLGAVLGHEVAHVTEEHSLERANREIGTRYGAAAGGAILGGGNIGDLVQVAAQYGLTLPYGRKQESEADTVGLVFSADAGFDPRESVKLWKNMAESNKGAPPEFLSTHPSSSTRIDDLIGEFPQALVRYNTAKSGGKNPQCNP
jgi:predicted Zn-dependent protease